MTILVLMLMLAYSMSFVDRQALALLVDPIKLDLGLTDTSFGVLQGMAFALFYIGFGIPLGRLADRGSRRNLVAAAMVAWSLATMACGTAGSFATLFAWRAMVGIGEAALTPSAYSMISDAVPKRHLAKALGFYSIGVYVGSGLALLVGAVLLEWLAQSELAAQIATEGTSPWRLVFVALGLPGLVVAALLLLVPEPARTHFDSSEPSELPTLRETMAFIAAERRMFGGMIAGFACHNTAMYALLSWTPAFVGRKFDLPPGEFGVMLGIATVIGGIVGLVSGGYISDHMMQRGVRDTPIRMGLASTTGIAIFGCTAMLVDSLPVTVWLYGITVGCIALPIGTAAAALQLVAPNRYRGQISALYIILISLAGLNIGPVLPPFISDSILDDPLRIGDALAMSLVGLTLISFPLFLSGRKAYARRYAAIHLAGGKGGATP